MPFTLAHPAASIPLLRPLGRMGVLSALVIGSIAPDLWYVIPLAARNESHSIAGLVTYCLPVGLLLYWIFHAGLKRPLIELFPPAIAVRLRAQAGPHLMPRATWPAVMVSLIVGGATHVAWDWMTHSRDGTVLFHIGSQQVRIGLFLQVAGSAIGLMLLAHWCMRWLRSAPAGEPAAHEPIDPARSALLVLALTALASVVVAVGYLEVLEHLELKVSALGGALRSLIVAGGVFALAYGAAWHLRQVRRAG
jgi:hypothetical protein